MRAFLSCNLHNSSSNLSDKNMPSTDRVSDLLRKSLFCTRESIRVWLVFALAVVAAGELHAQGYLIPDTTRRDMVFDFAGQNLYISTSTGLIKTFHLSTLTFGTSYDLGGSLNGIDIARNDSFLLTAQNDVGIAQGSFQRVDLATGIIININYTRAFGEGGAWDVAIASNGLALVTTQYLGSGWTPLRQIDLVTDTITTRTDAPGSGGGGELSAPTQIHRSADGTRFFFMEGNISSGPVFTYNAVSNTFGPSFQTDGTLSSAGGAVNRNGNLVALRTYGSGASLNTAPDFNFVHSFSGIDGGVAFDAVRDVFYGVNSTTDQIIAYSTATFAELFRLDIGENVQAAATTLVVSADGNWLALKTASGIRLFQSRAPTPAFFNGQVSLGNGWYWLQFPSSGNCFGYYNMLNFPWVYHQDMGWEYFLDANNGGGAYVYDASSAHWWYTSPTFTFPYLYDFSLQAVLYYLPTDSCRYSSNPRWFYNLRTNEWINL